MVFTKKIFVQGKWLILDPPPWIFLILHNKGDQEVHQNYINAFSQKIIVWSKWVNLETEWVSSLFKYLLKHL